MAVVFVWVVGAFWESIHCRSTAAGVGVGSHIFGSIAMVDFLMVDLGKYFSILLAIWSCQTGMLSSFIMFFVVSHFILCVLFSTGLLLSAVFGAFRCMIFWCAAIFPCRATINALSYLLFFCMLPLHTLGYMDVVFIWVVRAFWECIYWWSAAVGIGQVNIDIVFFFSDFLSFSSCHNSSIK